MGIRITITAWTLTLSAAVGTLGLGKWAGPVSFFVALGGHAVGTIADKKEDEREQREQIRAVAEQVSETDKYFSPQIVTTGDQKADLIKQKFKQLGIDLAFLGVTKGSAYDRYRFAPGPFQKMAAIDNHEPDLQYLLSSSMVPLVSKSNEGVCIDIPRGKRTFPEYEILPRPNGHAVILLGYDLGGKPYFVDLGAPSTPHLLVGGCTGSGKSEFIKMVMRSLMDWYTPQDIQFAIIDTKGFDFEFAKGLGEWLWRPVANEVEDGVSLLRELTEEMDRRKHLSDLSGVSRIVAIVDEVTDISNSGIKEVKKEGNHYLSVIARKGRKPKVHSLIGTQKPLASHLPSDIRDNLPIKVAMRTSTREDGHTITGINVSSEKLLGLGDLFCLVPGKPLVRLQSPLVTVPTRSLFTSMRSQTDLVWLTPKEAKIVAMVTSRTLARWADSGKIVHKKTDSGHRRYNKQSLMEYLESRTD
ncbi:MAG: hypothetical protein F6K53_20440 [Moorea sp. SIO4A1]|uniref:FtsK/SpoIIIE domain-containing protein n=1 Tax=Moorena sp. SIO4A1 TaxID=2607835 RepID=UPI001450015E|nr:FtsK/SpoIIIE domain-containing protein [Moorena sp. SIO4A1]NEQ59642.1 hypothetical protein [Moorena sp. SIO4A1]